jgi:hypothetical protein
MQLFFGVRSRLVLVYQEERASGENDGDYGINREKAYRDGKTSSTVSRRTRSAMNSTPIHSGYSIDRNRSAERRITKFQQVDHSIILKSGIIHIMY